jgi:hypothetical protein
MNRTRYQSELIIEGKFPTADDDVHFICTAIKTVETLGLEALSDVAVHTMADELLKEELEARPPAEIIPFPVRETV